MPSLDDEDFYHYRNFYIDQTAQIVQVFYKSLYLVSFSLNIISHFLERLSDVN